MENQNWLENTFLKIGNQIELEPVGFKNLKDNQYELELTVKNKGLSDQLYKNMEVQISSDLFSVSGEK